MAVMSGDDKERTSLGSYRMVGAFTGLFAAGALGAGEHPSILNFILVLVAAMVAAGLLGYLVERFAYRPLAEAPRINLLMTAVGVSLLLENLGQVVWGANPRVFPPIMPEEVMFTVAGVAVNNQQVLVLGDTPLDIHCARAIGAKVLAVATGGSPLDHLKAHFPDWAVPDLTAVCAAEIVG